MASTRQFCFRHIFYVFAVVLCPLHQIGVLCNTLNGTLLSCCGDCGNVRKMPCSCDVTCVILNKCCEDFADTCPLIFTQAMESLPHLMNTTVVCGEDSFFMIMSCPSDFERSEARESHQSFTNLDGNQSVTLLDVINNAPVSDLSTGLIFLNSEIYSCNGADESQMVRHEMEIGLTPGYTTTYFEPNRFLDLQKVAYTPSADIFPFIGNSACWKEDGKFIKTCADGTQNATAETVDKCENGMYTYVFFQRTYYKNRYCLACQTGQMERYTVVEEWRQSKGGFKFSAIASLTNDGAAVKLVVRDEGLSTGAAFIEVDCDIKKNEQTPDSTPCDVQRCGRDYQLLPDGQCVLLHNAVIGVSDGGYDFSEAETGSLPGLIACFLKEHFDVNVVYTDPKASQNCDERLKHVVYLVTARVALSYYSFNIFPVFEVKQNVVKFSALVKAFIRHRMNQRKDSCRVQTSSCDQDEDAELVLGCRTSDKDKRMLQDKDKRILQNFKSQKIAYYHYMEDLNIRGVIVDNTTTTVCLSSERADHDDLHVACWEEPLYENDLNLISEYMDSKCFSVLETNRANVYGVSSWLSVDWLFYQGLSWWLVVLNYCLWLL